MKTQKVPTLAASKAALAGRVRNPRSSWIFFSSKRRRELAKAGGSPSTGNVKMDFAHIGKKISQEWQAMSDEDKAPYTNQQREDLARYRLEMSKIDKATLAVHKKSRKRKHKDPREPKRPKSCFMFYAQNARTKIKQECPDMSFSEIGRELGRRWRDLPEEEKTPYLKEYQLDKQRYEREVEQMAAGDASRTGDNNDNKEKEQ